MSNLDEVMIGLMEKEENVRMNDRQELSYQLVYVIQKMARECDIPVGVMHNFIVKFELGEDGIFTFKGDPSFQNLHRSIKKGDTEKLPWWKKLSGG